MQNIVQNSLCVLIKWYRVKWKENWWTRRHTCDNGLEWKIDNIDMKDKELKEMIK